VRVIAATNRDLREMIEAGGFREDLYFRLNVFPVASVPLRRRIEDVSLLAHHFLQRACQKFNKPGVRIPPGQLDILKRYAWPGNIRELENVIERQVIVSQDRRLVFDDLLSAESGRAAPASLPAATERGPLPEQELSRRQHDNAITALMQSAGKVSGAGGAAELLGIKPTTLFSRLRKWGIEPADYKVNDKAS